MCEMGDSGRSKIFGRGVRIQADYCNSTYSLLHHASIHHGPLHGYVHSWFSYFSFLNVVLGRTASFLLLMAYIWLVKLTTT